MNGEPTRMLGEILVDEGIVSRERLDEALRLQKRRLGEILVEIGACKAEDLDRAVKLQDQGRTRAQVYLRYLRWALAAILFLVACLAVALLRLEQNSHLQLRIEKEALTPAEVAEILGDPDSPAKVDALRSLSHHLKESLTLQCLKTALKHDRWYVQLYAATLARDCADRSLVPYLIPLLVDDTRVVAPVALQTLQSLTGQTLPASVKAWREWARAQGINADAKN